MQIRDVYMQGPHKLYVQFTRLFEDEAQVYLSLVDNRRSFPVKSALYDLAAQYKPKRGDDTIGFDLETLGIQRFSSDFQGSVTIHLLNKVVGAWDSETQAVTVRIPIVMVPGIFNGQGGIKAVQDAITTLTAIDYKNFLSQNTMGNRYGLNPTYPILSAVTYNTSSDSFAAGARGVQTAVTEALANTYSDKCILVCHSKGGLVGRYFVQAIDKGKTVSMIVMIGTPHSGSAAAVLKENDYSAFNELLLWCLNGIGSDLHNLYPVDLCLLNLNTGWEVPTPVNAELNALNSLPWPNATSPLAVYTASSAFTPALLIYPGNGIIPSGLVAGDGMVPDWSAMGMRYNPLTKTTSPLPCFDFLKGGTPLTTISVTLPGVVPHAGMLGNQAVWDSLKLPVLGISPFATKSQRDLP